MRESFSSTAIPIPPLATGWWSDFLRKLLAGGGKNNRFGLLILMAALYLVPWLRVPLSRAVFALVTLIRRHSAWPPTLRWCWDADSSRDGVERPWAGARVRPTVF